MAKQGFPPSRSGRGPAPSPHRREAPPDHRSGWDAGPSLDDEEYPPWAGMAVSPKRARQEPHEPRTGPRIGPPQTGEPSSRSSWRDGPPGHGGRRDGSSGGGDGEPGTGPGRGGDGGGRLGFRSRAGAARARRARLRSYVWGGAAVAVAAITAVVLLQLGGHPARRLTAGGLVTTYLPGEMKAVPRACSAAPAATLTQAMQGTPTSLAPQSLDGTAQSVCDWTVDAPPVYRHLEVTLQAYTPSGLASGDGSATNAAKDAYAQALQQKVKPPKGSGLPKAAVSQPGHLGTQAFIALQRVKSAGNVTDIETVVTRVHNVLVTVVLQGSHTGRYGPVPVARLASGAIEVARQVLSRLG